MKRARLYLGCTAARHRALGVHAVINARGGRPELNDLSLEEIERERDARAIRDRLERRVRFYGFGSRFFRRHRERFAHLISNPND